MSGEGNSNGGVGTKYERRPSVDYRHNCGRLLFRGYLAVGTALTIRCPKCGGMAVYEVLAVTPPLLTEAASV